MRYSDKPQKTVFIIKIVSVFVKIVIEFIKSRQYTDVMLASENDEEGVHWSSTMDSSQVKVSARAL